MLVPLPATPPERPPVTEGSGQVYVVPAGIIPFVTFAGVRLKGSPLHMVAAIAVIEGFGSMVSVTVNVGPVQPPDVGVTVYIAVCAVFVILVRVPLIVGDPPPAAPPVKLIPEGAVHE
jgi:hypothetical protein